MELKSKKIKKAIERVISAKSAYSAAVYDVVSKCKHENVAECDYMPSGWLPALAPERVCLDCGLAEEGWGCGYQLLTSRHTVRIDREELWKLVTVRFFQDEDIPRLLRREVTFNDLLCHKLGLGGE